MQDAGLVRLGWAVNSKGYKLVERRARGSTILTEQPAGSYIVPQGGEPRIYEVGLKQTEITVDLANASTQESAVAFADKWGLPDQPYRQRHDAKSGIGEMAVQNFLAVRERLAWSMGASAAAVKKWLLGKPALSDPMLYKIFCDLYGEEAAAQKFGIEDPSFAVLRAVWYKNRLVYRPGSLIQLCWMQRLQALDVGADVSSAGLAASSCRTTPERAVRRTIVQAHANNVAGARTRSAGRPNSVHGVCTADFPARNPST